jgi:hypothetical protein
MGRHAESQQSLRLALGRIERSGGGQFQVFYNLADLLETAVLLEDVESVRLLVPWLEDAPPFGAGAWQTFVPRQLAMAALLLGQRDEALAHARHALEVAEQLRFRPEVALAHLLLAELLDQALSDQQSAVSPPPTASGGEEKLTADRLKAESLAHLDFAIAEFRAMKMQPSLERALRHREQLTT